MDQMSERQSLGRHQGSSIKLQKQIEEALAHGSFLH